MNGPHMLSDREPKYRACHELPCYLAAAAPARPLPGCVIIASPARPCTFTSITSLPAQRAAEAGWQN